MANNPTMAIRISANVEELRKNLAEGRDQIEYTTAAMQKMAASFSGDKLIQAAHNTVAAVNEIGGASNLTEKEMARVNARLDAAIQKLGLLGKEAPAAMLAMEQATRAVHPPLDQTDVMLGKIWSGLKSAAGLMGIAFSAQAVVGFVGHVFDAASNIHDMALKLGISAEAVQGFGFAASQAGSSLDAVGTAITKMNQHLALGDASTVRALQDAKLNFAAIRAMRPEDAFLAIADAIEKMSDPMMRSRVQLALFGKGGAELLPAMVDHFRQTADSVKKMSTETVNSLEAAQDAWTALGNKVTVITGGIIAHMIDSGTYTAKFQEEVMKFGMEAAIAMQKGAAAAADFKDTLAQFEKEVKNLPAALPVDPLVEYRKHLKEVEIGVGSLTREQVALVMQATRLHESVTDIAHALGVNEQAVNAVVEAERKHQEALKKSTELEARAVEEVTKLSNEYHTLRVAHSGTAFDTQMAQIKQWADDLTARMKRAGTDSVAFYDMLARVSKEKMSEVAIDWGFMRSNSIESLQDIAARARATYEEMSVSALHFSREVMEEQRQKVIETADAARNLGSSYVDAFAKATEAAQRLKDKIEATKAEAAAAAAAARSIGGTFDVQDLTDQQFQGLGGAAKLRDIEASYLTMPGRAPGGSGITGLTSNDSMGYLAMLEERRLYLALKRYLASHSFAGGVTNFSGGLAMVGERGPELVNLPRGSNVTPAGGAGTSIVININGSVLGNKEEIARVVGDALMGRLRGIGMRVPVGA